MDKEKINIFHYRWAIPIIAKMYELHGVKYITLVNNLGISRSMLSKTLKYLIQSKLIQKNSGHGHPLRPEYILAKRGKIIGKACFKLVSISKKDHFDLLLKSKWSAIILFLSNTNGTHFSEYKQKCPSLTARSLSLELKQLVTLQFIQREIVDSNPPRTQYHLYPKSKKVIKTIRTLLEYEFISIN